MILWTPAAVALNPAAAYAELVCRVWRGIVKRSIVIGTLTTNCHITYNLVAHHCCTATLLLKTTLMLQSAAINLSCIFTQCLLLLLSVTIASVPDELCSYLITQKKSYYISHYLSLIHYDDNKQASHSVTPPLVGFCKPQVNTAVTQHTLIDPSTYSYAQTCLQNLVTPSQVSSQSTVLQNRLLLWLKIFEISI